MTKVNMMGHFITYDRENKLILFKKGAIETGGVSLKINGKPFPTENFNCDDLQSPSYGEPAQEGITNSEASKLYMMLQNFRDCGEIIRQSYDNDVKDMMDLLKTKWNIDESIDIKKYK